MPLREMTYSYLVSLAMLGQTFYAEYMQIFAISSCLMASIHPATISKTTNSKARLLSLSPVSISLDAL